MSKFKVMHLGESIKIYLDRKMGSALIIYSIGPHRLPHLTVFILNHLLTLQSQ